MLSRGGLNQCCFLSFINNPRPTFAQLVLSRYHFPPTYISPSISHFNMLQIAPPPYSHTSLTLTAPTLLFFLAVLHFSDYMSVPWAKLPILCCLMLISHPDWHICLHDPSFPPDSSTAKGWEPKQRQLCFMLHFISCRQKYWIQGFYILKLVK